MPIEDKRRKPGNRASVVPLENRRKPKFQFNGLTLENSRPLLEKAINGSAPAHALSQKRQRLTILPKVAETDTDHDDVDESDVTVSEYDDDGVTTSDESDHLSDDAIESSNQWTPPRKARRKRKVKTTISQTRSKKKQASSRTYSSAAPIAIAAKKVRTAPFLTACTKLDHRHCDDDDDLLASPSAPWADVCPLLTMFQMYFCRLGLVCRRCGAMIPSAELLKHLVEKHKHMGGARAYQDYAFVVAHIMETHGFSVDTVFDWSMELSQHVDGLPFPTLYNKCPIPACPVWRPVGTKIQPGCVRITQASQTHFIRQHVKKDHKAEKDNHPDFFKETASFETRYVLRPYRNRTLKFALLIFTEGWTPPEVPAILPAPIPINRKDAKLAAGAQFLQTLHYPQYVEGLHASNRRLRQLVQVPNREAAAKLKHKRTRDLEIGLCELYDALWDYLKDANIWLDEHHPQVRDAFVNG
jgi:hypothetical protein